MKRFDIVIVGGGLVGLSLALALRHLQLKIAVIDAEKISAPCEKLFALNHQSCQLLDAIGIWARIRTQVTKISQVHVSYQGRFGTVRLNCADSRPELPYLGQVIPEKILEQAINDELESALSNDITLFQPARLIELRQLPGHAELVIDANQTKINLEARIVIGADGANSTVRKLLGINISKNEYSQRALVTRIKLRRSHQHIAYERFLQHGAIAMLPLNENECATIWTANNADIELLLNLNSQEFTRELQTQFGYRLGKIEKTGDRYSYPLQKIMADEIVKGNVLLIGNAAHTIHPIAAQGLNASLQEVFLVANSIKSNFNKEVNNMHHVNLNLIELARTIKSAQKFNLELSHKLMGIFTSDSILVSFATQLGMVSLDSIGVLKRKFLHQVTGNVF